MPGYTDTGVPSGPLRGNGGSDPDVCDHGAQFVLDEGGISGLCVMMPELADNVLVSGVN